MSPLKAKLVGFGQLDRRVRRAENGRMVKRIFQHVEGAHFGVLFGFIGIGVALLKDYGLCALVTMVVVGILLALSAAHNAYVAKSTALVDKYDERFFEKMSRQRKSAALFVLGENPNADELEDVLDFFESPIASKVKEGAIDAKQVYEIFYHWVRVYYEASQTFIAEYRKSEPAAYTGLSGLYEELSVCEKKEIGTDKDLRLTPERLKEYLQQEANLKTEFSDWEKVFRAGSSGCGGTA